MRFLADGIGDLVLEKLAKAREVRLAVAFFNPNERMMDALARVPDLKLVVSEEFTVNNPYKLERLKAAKVRSIPPYDAEGKLHSKVLMVTLRRDSHWFLLGSANFTYQGLFANREACVVLDSTESIDRSAVADISRWFELLFQVARRPDLHQAKLIFDARSQYCLVPRPSAKLGTDGQYWALKTTSGSTGKQHWPMFLADGVIAVGWSGLPLNPAKVSDVELRGALVKTYTYSERQAQVAATQIRKFVGVKPGDIILLCRGYTSNQDKDVHIHGVARVTGPFRAEPHKKGEWRFKHDAVIQEINLDLPRYTVASALKKKSLRQTIHCLTKPSFDLVADALKEFGVHLEV